MTVKILETIPCANLSTCNVLSKSVDVKWVSIAGQNLGHFLAVNYILIT